MRGDIPRLPHTPSLRGVQLKHRDNFTFLYTDIRFKHGLFPKILFFPSRNSVV
jgi:hypothetical protein